MKSLHYRATGVSQTAPKIPAICQPECPRTAQIIATGPGCHSCHWSVKEDWLAVLNATGMTMSSGLGSVCWAWWHGTHGCLVQRSPMEVQESTCYKLTLGIDYSSDVWIKMREEGRRVKNHLFGKCLVHTYQVQAHVRPCGREPKIQRHTGIQDPRVPWRL